MMESTTFFNAKAMTPEVSLFLDIDPKKDVIKSFFFDGPHFFKYQVELEEIKSKVLGQTLEEASRLSRDDLNFEVTLENKEKAVAARGLWLLREAIATYLGEKRFLAEQSDLLCLCFTVTEKDVVQMVLADKDFELKTLIQKTMASSACGSCKTPILKLIEDTRQTHGLIKGLDHSKSRFDKEGKWIKIAGLYPGPLLLKLEELKNKWMKREGIVGQFQIEFINIEGFHLNVSVNSATDKMTEKTTQGLLLALSDFLKSRLGVLFFLHAV